MADKARTLAGRKAVDAYREAHRQLHNKPWHKDIPREHTPLLERLVANLERLSFTSVETDFEPKKTEILARFWAESEELNVQELGFKNRVDFRAKATEADREALRLKWK